jgi:hypothetical protein
LFGRWELSLEPLLQELCHAVRIVEAKKKASAFTHLWRPRLVIPLT